MSWVHRNGAPLAALVALLIAAASWLRGDGGRMQQIADLQQQLTQISQQVQHLQQELDEYLVRHDGGH